MGDVTGISRIPIRGCKRSYEDGVNSHHFHEIPMIAEKDPWDNITCLHVDANWNVVISSYARSFAEGYRCSNSVTIG